MQQRNEPLPGLLYEAQLPPPPEQLRQYNSMGRAADGSVELASVSVSNFSDEDEHYQAHTDTGTERMFPMRAHHQTHEALPLVSGNSEESASSHHQTKIPSVAAVGLGVIGLGMMTDGKPNINKVASSPSNTSSYSDVELSDGSLDRSSTALQEAVQRDSGPGGLTNSTNRVRGGGTASPPTRVAESATDDRRQGL